jgi:hypothetical protein
LERNPRRIPRTRKSRQAAGSSSALAPAEGPATSRAGSTIILWPPTAASAPTG